MAASSRARRFGVLAFLSGMCALAYEVLYLRQLTPLLGDALHVHAAFLATFLLGVAAGSRFAYRLHRRLAPIEGAVGVIALAFPAAVGALSASGALGALAASPAGAAAATALLVAAPALLLGAGLPLFSAYVKEARGGGGPAFQDVYAAYNLGAFAGIVLVEAVLVRALGIRTSLALFGAVNLGVAAALWASGSTQIARPPSPPRVFARRLEAAVLLAGAASGLTQLLLLRTLDLVLQPHRANFALGLAVILGGLALGSRVAARTPIRFETLLLAVPLPLLGAFALAVSPVGFLWGDPAPAGAAPTGVLALRLLYAALLGLLPMTLFGATLPALMRQERAVAEESGRLLWLAGVANAAGYLAYLTLLAPRLTGGALLALVAGLSLVAAWVAAGGRPGRAARWGTGAGVVAAALVAAAWDDADWHLATRRDLVGSAARVEIFRWGGESATLVTEPPVRWISYNGHPSIRVDSAGVVNAAEVLSGVIPAVTAPALDRALVLGLGTGITAGAAARSFDTVDVAELNGAFLEMAPHLASASLGILDNPRARIHVADARTFLAGRDGAYDAIVNSIPAPTYYAAGKVYTVDFYRAVLAALRPGGVFTTWLSAAEMSAEGYDVVLGALAEVFRHCAPYLLREDYHMVSCSAAPVGARPLGEATSDAVLLGALREGLGGADPEEHLEDVRLADDLFARRRPPSAPRNTDDRPVLEYLVLGPREPAALPPFERDPEAWGVDPGRPREGDTPERTARRARTWARLHPAWFGRYFRPLLEADPALAEAWRALGEGRVGPTGNGRDG